MRIYLNNAAYILSYRLNENEQISPQYQGKFEFHIDARVEFMMSVIFDR